MNGADRCEERIRNWAAWWNRGSSGSGGGCCASAERMYVAPRPDEEQGCARQISTIDVDDAEWIEQGIKKMADRRDQNLLRAWYVMAVKPQVIIRRAECSLETIQARREKLVLLACRNADRLREIERAKTTSLIRRGAPLWAGLAPGFSPAYKSHPSTVASVELTTRRVQALPGSAWPEEQEKPA